MKWFIENCGGDDGPAAALDESRLIEIWEASKGCSYVEAVAYRVTAVFCQLLGKSFPIATRAGEVLPSGEHQRATLDGIFERGLAAFEKWSALGKILHVHDLPKSPDSVRVAYSRGRAEVAKQRSLRLACLSPTQANNTGKGKEATIKQDILNVSRFGSPGFPVSSFLSSADSPPVWHTASNSRAFSLTPHKLLPRVCCPRQSQALSVLGVAFRATCNGGRRRRGHHGRRVTEEPAARRTSARTGLAPLEMAGTGRLGRLGDER